MLSFVQSAVHQHSTESISECNNNIILLLYLLYQV
jgi:hypothetical protein